MSSTIPLLFILPVELVFKVISFIDERRDLLALALTCHALKKFLIPDHIDHLEIHCPPHMLDLWDHLLKRQVLWQCVQTLDLTHSSNDSLILPPKFRTLKYKWQAYRGNFWNTEESLASLYELLSRLENLTRFRVVVQHAAPQIILSRLSEALKASGCHLERLEIDVSGTSSAPNNPAENLGRNISLSLPNLHSLSGLSISASNQNDPKELPIIDILIEAPSLTQLRLHLPDSKGPIILQILDTLFTLHWPCLKHLTLEEIRYVNIDDLKLIAFFKRHTALETLYFDNVLLPGCFSTESTSSTLQSLHYFSRNNGEGILRLGDIIPKTVAKGLVDLSIGGTMNPELGIEPLGLSSLKTCFLPGFKDSIYLSFIPELVKVAPNIQKCCIPLDKPSGTESVVEILPLFKPFMNLTQLFGLLRHIETAQLSKQPFLDTLYKLSSLTYTVASSPQGKSCIRLIRQLEGGIDFEIIPFHVSYRRPDLNPGQWSNFFRGFRQQNPSINQYNPARYVRGFLN